MNLSETILPEAEMSLLGKGLTFVDTPEQSNLGILAEDLNKFPSEYQKASGTTKILRIIH